MQASARGRHILALVALMGVLAAPAAECADLAGARVFLTRLYAHYPEPKDGGSFDPVGRSAPEVFDAPMVALLRKDAAQTPPGDEGAIDWDPICGCQDDGGMTYRIESLTASGPTQAIAVIRVKVAGDSERLELQLSAVNGPWRIHDIKSKDVPSLRAYLIQTMTKSLR